MQIFISYSSQTRDIVKTLTEDVEGLGHGVWFDRELTGGRKWWADILEQIRNCDLFLFALTPHSLDSYPCKLEYSYANALNKRILPVMLADITIKVLPSALQELQFVDYRQRSKQQLLDLSKAFSNLPPAVAVPDPLPPEPETPLPPLARLRDRVEASSLGGDEQTLLLFEIKGFLESKETAEEAHLLLEQFLKRQDLLARIEKELHSLLDDTQPAKASKYKTLPSLPAPVFEHPDSVLSVAFSPDGQYIATGGLDTQARIWEIATYRELLKFPHKHTVHSVAFSPNGITLLTGCEDNKVYLWDTEMEEILEQFNGHKGTDRSVAFSPDGKYVLAGSDDFTARLWDVKTGERLRTFSGHKDSIRSVAYSPSGRFVLTGSDDTTARLRHPTSGEELRKFDGLEYEVSSVAFSPDERFILIAADKVVQTFDLVRGSSIHEFIGHTHDVRSAAFSPDGRLIVTGSRDTTVRLWDAATGKELHQLTGHSASVLSVSFSPDGKNILSGSVDRTARLWALDDIF